MTVRHYLHRFLQKRHRYFIALALSIVSLLAMLVVLNFLYPLKLPQDDALFAQVVTDNQGRPLRAFADSKGVWRYPIRLEDVSPLYLETLLQYEDRWFYYHPGVNPVALMRALFQNVKHGEVVSGGSTISMQLARLLHPHSRSIGGKIYQSLRALQLEWRLSKDEILQLYCNIAPFGGTIEGVQAASFTYLDKSAKDLSLAEAALLTVLPQAPTRLRPDLHPQAAEKARNKVLRRMATQGVFSTAQIADAEIEAVNAYRFVQGQHAALLARRLVDERKNSQPSAEQFGPIYSTIDGELQKSLEDYLQTYIARFPRDTSAAILVVENSSAKVKAYLGTADFANEERFGHVDMVQAIRSPGSTLKPFLYAMTIDAGLIHSQSLLADVPRTWGTYRPGNFNQGFSGPVSAAQALQRSLNMPAVELLERFGEHRFVAALNNAGVDLHLPAGEPNLAVILGGVGTSLENLLKGYMALANGGQVRELIFTDQIKTEVENELNNEQRHGDAQGRFLFSPQASWIVQEILRGVARPGQLHTLANTLSQSQLAWKTGTSYGHRDTWALGVNKRYTLGVWLGRPDGTPIPGSDGRGSAGPLLHAVADHITTRVDNKIAQPQGLEERIICWPLGTLLEDQPPQHCHRQHQAWLIEGSVPPTWHSADKNSWRSNLQRFWLNPLSGKRVTSACESLEKISSAAAVWPKVLEPWLAQHYRRRHLIPPMDDSCGNAVSPAASPVQITGIEHGSVYRSLDPQNASVATVLLAAIGGEGRYHWYINGRHRFSRQKDAAMNVSLDGEGDYQIVVVDDYGNSDAVTIKAI